MSDSEDNDDKEKTIAEDLVVTKYKMAGEMVNRVLQKVMDKGVAGETVLSLCEYGDSLLLEETGKVYKKEKDVKKGIAFPTCISVNNCICHFSPVSKYTEVKLADGDIVKIDLGAHVDGFIAVGAHTYIIGATKETPVTGKKADAILAAHYAAEAALRLIKPDNENTMVTDGIQKVAESFKCKPIEGMLSHQLKRFKIDGDKAVIQNPTEAQRKEHEKAKFELHEVYAIDMLISSGEGKGRELDAKTTIFKKTDENYQLKLKAARSFFTEMDKKCGSMPFTLRSFEADNTARLGIQECIKHKLVEPFQVLYEKEREVVAQFKYTVLLMPTGSHKITGLPFDASLYKSEHRIVEEELLQLLSKGTSTKPQGKKKKKKVSVSEKDLANGGATAEVAAP